MLITAVTANENVCESKCYCGFGNVDCSGKGIQKIPLVPDDTINLDIQNNKITSLSSAVQASIIHLDLTKNNIGSVVKSEIEKFPDLSSINFDDNNIKDFDSNVFGGMLNLKFVMARRNGMRKATLGKLPPKIKIIRLEENLIRFVEFQKSFDRNGSVQIYLENNPIHCGCTF